MTSVPPAAASATTHETLLSRIGEHMVFKLFVLVVAAYTVPGQPGRFAEEQAYMQVGPNSGFVSKHVCRQAMRTDSNVRGDIASHIHYLDDLVGNSTQPGDLANERVVVKCLADKNDL